MHLKIIGQHSSFPQSHSALFLLKLTPFLYFIIVTETLTHLTMFSTFVAELYVRSSLLSLILIVVTACMLFCAHPFFASDGPNMVLDARYFPVGHEPC